MARRWVLHLRASLFNLAFFAWTGLLAVAALPALPFWSPRQTRAYARFWLGGVQALLRVLVGLCFEVRGLDKLPPGPVLIAAKHQSAWETLVFHLLVPELAVALKEELVRIPVFGWYLRRAGNITISRESPRRAMRSLIEGAKAALARGESVLIFPEGTRRPVGAPPDYKPGVAALYRALGVPCVPVALNSGLFWGRRSWIKYPGCITVAFLDPIPPGLERGAFLRLLADRIERASRELVEEARARGMGAPGPSQAGQRPPFLSSSRADPAAASEAGDGSG